MICVLMCNLSATSFRVLEFYSNLDLLQLLLKSFMTVTVDVLTAFGCPGSEQALGCICEWLRQRVFYDLRDLRGAGNVRELKGSLCKLCTFFGQGLLSHVFTFQMQTHCQKARFASCKNVLMADFTRRCGTCIFE